MKPSDSLHYLTIQNIHVSAIVWLRTLVLMALCLPFDLHAQPSTIDLSGTWTVRLGAEARSVSVRLPGTTDTNHLGAIPADTTETTHLTRAHRYKGAAAYSRDFVIPKAWKHCRVTLLLERTKPSWLYLDGKLIDSCNDISTPQRYVFPQKMKPGRHLLTIVVDNSRGVPTQLYASSHAYTEDTQTNWNGIIGRIELSAEEARKENFAADRNDRFVKPRLTTDGHHFYDNGKMVFLRGKHDACVWPQTGHVPMDTASWFCYLRLLTDYGINHVRFHSWCPPEAAFVAADSLHIYLQPELPFWGDFNERDSVLMTFLHKEGMNILKEYGHHPSFAMMALGNELWGSVPAMQRFVNDFRCVAPQICFTFGSNYYLGYKGIQPGMDYITTCRLGGEAWGAYNTHTRASFSFADAADGGLLNHLRPNTSMNFNAACNTAAVPVISHETGQFQSYPDLDREMPEYQGVLKPYNMAVFRRRLARAGMLDQMKAFHQASGAWAVELYKADIEMDLRTRNMAGFQLLDLQDYPGQGSAYVGILDANLHDKGYVSPERWRQWCAPVVPLLVADSLCWAEGDTLRMNVQIANYSGQSLAGKRLRWTLEAMHPSSNDAQSIDMEGTLPLPDGEGLIDVGMLPCNRVAEVLRRVRTAVGKDWRRASLRLTLSVTGTSYRNSYQLWCYPDDNLEKAKQGILITRQMTDDVVKRLEQGARVLWMPDTTELKNTVGPLFITDYWNYRMFKTICENNHKAVSPGTLGILTDPNHPLFNSFATENHTNWQWFPVVKASHPLVLDNLPADYRPLVQVIDNIERNHRLGLVLEFRVGRGNLLVCMSDLDEAARHPEGRAFYLSLLRYMHSSAFAPTTAFEWTTLHNLLTGNVKEGELKQLFNTTQY